MPAYSECPGCTTVILNYLQEIGAEKVDECLFVLLRRKKLFSIQV
jgi:hypothetical protein